MSWIARWFYARSTKVTRPQTPARLRLESLEERQVPTVTFHGGAVLQNVEAQGVYLGSGWAGSATPATLDSFLSNITGSAYMDALTQAGYGVGKGTATAGKVDNVALTSGSTITDQFIQNELKADISSGLVATPDANRLYIVYVQPNVAVNLNGSTSVSNFLGYHNSFVSSNGTTIRYAVVTYPGGSVGNASSGNSAIDQLTSVTSHELAEAVTDPDVGFNQVNRLGWYDFNRNGEIGDITENNPNAYIRLNGYLVQEVADKNDNLLVVNTAPSNPPPPPPPPPAPGSTVSTSSHLSAGRVHYYSNGTASVALTVKIAPASGSVLPSGQVELMYNGSVLATGTIKVVNGVAQVTFNVTFSSFSYYTWDYYTFSAVFLGSSQFGTSTSNNVTVAV